MNYLNRIAVSLQEESKQLCPFIKLSRHSLFRKVFFSFDYAQSSFADVTCKYMQSDEAYNSSDSLNNSYFCFFALFVFLTSSVEKLSSGLIFVR